MTDPILTLPEVARHLKLSRTQVYRLARSGELPVVQIGRSVRVRQSDLERWIVARVRNTPVVVDTL